MPKDKTGIRGKVTAVVYTFPKGRAKELLAEKDVLEKAGKKYALKRFMSKYCKRWQPGFFGKLFRVRGPLMITTNHNIVPNEGDALIADLMQETPERVKVDNTNGKIGVGTGFIDETKTRDALVTQVGANEALDATYPHTKGDWAAADDNVVLYRATFEAGDVTSNGLDETLLGNGTDTFAYAQLSPAVDVGAADTLEINWETTFLGS